MSGQREILAQFRSISFNDAEAIGDKPVSYIVVQLASGTPVKPQDALEEPATAATLMV